MISIKFYISSVTLSCPWLIISVKSGEPPENKRLRKRCLSCEATPAHVVSGAGAS